MGIAREKLRDAVETLTFSTGLSIIAVEGVEMAQAAMEALSIQISKVALVLNPQYPAMVAGVLGMAIGNCYGGSGGPRNAYYALIGFGAGYVAGAETAQYAISPYVAGFTAAAVGLVTRRMDFLFDKPESEKPRPRRYDDRQP